SAASTLSRLRRKPRQKSACQLQRSLGRRRVSAGVRTTLPRDLRDDNGSSAPEPKPRVGDAGAELGSPQTHLLSPVAERSALPELGSLPVARLQLHIEADSCTVRRILRR